MSWLHHAACRGYDDQIEFFPNPGQDPYDAYRRCVSCPVTNACAAAGIALPASENFGIWGLTTPQERTAIRAGKTTLARVQLRARQRLDRHDNPPPTPPPQTRRQRGRPTVAQTSEHANRYLKPLGTTLNKLRTSNKDADTTRRRHLLCWLLARRHQASSPTIGHLLARDHSTVLHSIHRIDQLLADNDPDTVELLARVDTEPARTCAA